VSRLDAIREARTFEELYALIPSPRGCTGQCAESCGPIGFSTEEGRRLEAAGCHIPNIHERDILTPITCPALVDGRCSVYQSRPTLCRIWGACEPMPCPYLGCSILDPLTTEETEAVSWRAFELGGMPGVIEWGGVLRT
jgi:Fe-S-cluster containining protein